LDDGFYYMPNLNVTRDVATANNCSALGAGGVRPYATPVDGTTLAVGVNWTCFASYGSCALRGHPTDVVRCTWAGKHVMPARTHLPNVDATPPHEKHLFFARVMWAFVSRFARDDHPRGGEQVVEAS